jgi:hypothetical protein
MTPLAVDYTGDFVVVVGRSGTNSPALRIFDKVTETWSNGPTLPSGLTALIGISRIGNRYAIISNSNKLVVLTYSSGVWSFGSVITLPLEHAEEEQATGIATDGSRWVISGSVTGIWTTTETDVLPIISLSPLTVGNGKISGIYYDGYGTVHDEILRSYFCLTRKDITTPVGIAPVYLNSVMVIGNFEDGFEVKGGYRISILSGPSDEEAVPYYLDVKAVNNTIISNSYIEYTLAVVAGTLPSPHSPAPERIYTALLRQDQLTIYGPVDHVITSPGLPILTQTPAYHFLSSRNLPGNTKRSSNVGGTPEAWNDELISADHIPYVIAAYNRVVSFKTVNLNPGDRYKTIIAIPPVDTVNFTTTNFPPIGPGAWTPPELQNNFMIYVKNGSNQGTLLLQSDGTNKLILPRDDPEQVSPFAIGYFTDTGINFY